jgi:hypothetical protein
MSNLDLRRIFDGVIVRLIAVHIDRSNNLTRDEGDEVTDLVAVQLTAQPRSSRDTLPPSSASTDLCSKAVLI